MDRTLCWDSKHGSARRGIFVLPHLVGDGCFFFEVRSIHLDQQIQEFSKLRQTYKLDFVPARCNKFLKRHLGQKRWFFL